MAVKWLKLLVAHIRILSECNFKFRNNKSWRLKAKIGKYFQPNAMWTYIDSRTGRCNKIHWQNIQIALLNFYCVLKNRLDEYSVYFTNSTSYSFIQITGFEECPEFKEICGRIYLIHDGHRFTKHHVQNSRTYWRCSVSWRFKCSARIITQYINGREMSKVSNCKHTHFRQHRD